jgi:hypothetical protein
VKVREERYAERESMLTSWPLTLIDELWPEPSRQPRLEKSDLPDRVRAGNET